MLQNGRQSQKNILLILYNESIEWGDWAVPPIGIAYVSSFLKSRGCNVFNLNLNVERGKWKDIVRDCIAKNKIDIVGAGGLVTQFAALKELMDFIKSIDKRLVTIIGGGLVTYSPKEAMLGIESADIGIIGEGEITAFELIRALETGKDLSEVDGLVYKGKNNELCFTDPRAPIEDLDMLPFPDREGFKLFEMDTFSPSVELHKKIVSTPLVTSRGCPFSCTYCSKSGGSKKYRQRSLDNIFDELKILVCQKNVNMVFLDDELFASKMGRVYEFCERIKELHVQWVIFLRVGPHITDELLRKMKESGCIQICYGFESGSDRVLKSMRKGITAGNICDTVLRTSNAGILSRGNFIFGDVVETRETVEETFRLARKLIGYNVSVNYTMIRLYPGAKLYDLALQEGRIANPLEFIKNKCPLVNMSMLSDEEYNHWIQDKIQTETEFFYSQLLNKDVSLSFTGIDRKERKYIFSLLCPHCGNVTKFSVYPQSVFIPYSLSCGRCHELQTFILLKCYAQYLDPVLSELFSSKHVIIWCLSIQLTEFYSVSEALKRGNWMLVDDNEGLWGKVRNGRIIQSPDVIRECRDKEIVVLTSGHFGDIKFTVDNKYPEVSSVFNLWELGLNLSGETPE